MRILLGLLEFDPNVEQIRLSNDWYSEHLRAQIDDTAGMRSDLNIKVQGCIFHLHQYPFVGRSDTMKSELERGTRNKVQYIRMDSWMRVCAFEFFVRYIYTGKLEASPHDKEWTRAMKGERVSITEFSTSELLNLF